MKYSRSMKKTPSNLHRVMTGRKNAAHVEKGKREKDRQKLKNNLKRGNWE